MNSFPNLTLKSLSTKLPKEYKNTSAKSQLLTTNVISMPAKYPKEETFLLTFSMKSVTISRPILNSRNKNHLLPTCLR